MPPSLRAAAAVRTGSRAVGRDADVVPFDDRCGGAEVDALATEPGDREAPNDAAVESFRRRGRSHRILRPAPSSCTVGLPGVVPGCVVPSMITASLSVGSGLATLIFRTGPGRSKSIVSVPGVWFAAIDRFTQRSGPGNRRGSRDCERRWRRSRGPRVQLENSDVLPLSSVAVAVMTESRRDIREERCPRGETRVPGGARGLGGDRSEPGRPLAVAADRVAGRAGVEVEAVRRAGVGDWAVDVTGDVVDSPRLRLRRRARRSPGSS